MKLTTKFTAIFDRTSDLLALLAAILLTFLMLIICVQVVMRYFLMRPMPGVIEISEVSLVYITFLGATWLLRREGHVKMDMVLTRLNRRTRAWVNTVTAIIGAGTCLIITWYSALATWSHAQMGHYVASTIDIPTAPILAVIPVCCFLLFIQFLRRAYGYLGVREHYQTKDKGPI